MSSSISHRALSILLLSLAVVGGAAIWSATDVAAGLAAATGSVSEAADVLDESLDTADSVLASIGDGLEGADLIVAEISASTELTAVVVDQASELVSNDVADSVESVERALPGLIEAGRVIDNTLATLEFFGVAYDAEVPLGEALVEVEASVSGLADQLRAQGEGLGQLSAPVRGAGVETAALAGVLSDVQAALGDAATQLEEYRDTSSSLRDAVDAAAVDTGLLETSGRLFALLWAATAGLAAFLMWTRSGPDLPRGGIEPAEPGNGLQTFEPQEEMS